MGQMINLLSNDVSRFDAALTVFHYLWIGPLQTIIVTYFLWKEIGISSLFGISTFFVFIPLQGLYNTNQISMNVKMKNPVSQWRN